MDNWFVLTLGDAMFAGAALDDLLAQLNNLSDAKHWGEHSAVLTRHESEGRLHCELMVYFSPALQSLAQAVGARPCVQPSPEGLSVLLGSSKLELLFSPGT